MNKTLRLVIPIVALLGLMALTWHASADVPVAPEQATPTPVPNHHPGSLEDKQQIQAAIGDAIARESENILSYLVHEEQTEDVEISSDGNYAIAWIILRNPDSGEILPTEPGLVLAAKDPSLGWVVTLPSDPGWVDRLVNAPAELISEEVKATWLQMYQNHLKDMDNGPYGGYLLPWAAGEVAWLSQSVAHDKYITSGSAHYAFDFYVPKTMFNLYAAKSGIVWLAKWDVSNNNHDGAGNYIVLQDNTTDPTTYQLYLHLAQDSIPPALRVRGAQVVRGQFIGVADNTGQSTGHHLHYQVHTNPNSYWGTSVDITFEDVSINGGRPRVHNSYYSDLPYCQRNEFYNDVCDQFQSSYTSGNIVHGDTSPPYGDISNPVTGAQIDSGTVTIQGWAKDDESGLDRVQILGNYQGSWTNIGDPFTSTSFSYSWDMCSDKVPNGPVSLALAIWDQQGNKSFGLPGLSHFTKNYSCPPRPTCTPDQNQVALFTEPDLKGACITLGANDYPNSSYLANLGDDNVESIKVGSNVLATLYSDTNYNGRGETFSSDDSNLDDNPIGGNRLSSLKVKLVSEPPEPPAALISPINGSAFDFKPSLTLSWRVPGGGTEFQTRLSGPGGDRISSWSSKPIWHLDELNLTSGDYTWEARTRNDSYTSTWSTPSAFTVGSGDLPAASIAAPLTEDFENSPGGWKGTGLWNLIDDGDESHSLSHSWHYGDDDGDYKTDSNYPHGPPNSGDLTSPEISLPSTNPAYALSFWYRYKTEGPQKHWDQRWVQISENGGPFRNVLQLYDDPENFWLKPVIDLSEYAGSNIRVRFHFETLDGAFNYYQGWFIDDFEISTTAVEECTDTNDIPEEATPIAYGETKSEVICPSGDIDIYKFEAKAGDRIVADIDTPTENPPSDLDMYLFLLDGDGRSTLSEHDDEVFAVRRDPHLGYLIDRAGVYYLKIRSWAHPSAGGNAYTYTLKVDKDKNSPVAKFKLPASETYLPDGKLHLQIEAGDDLSGISHVDFAWHSGNWLHEKWTTLGSDWDGSDGWGYSFDTSALPEQTDIAFFAHVYDWAGNWAGVGAWDLGLDRTAPVTALNLLSNTQPSNAVKLSWKGSDNLSGISEYNLQYTKDESSWTAVSPDPQGVEQTYWFIGEPGANYEFRLRGVDMADNAEAFLTKAETSTSIPSVPMLCSELDQWEDDGEPGSATEIKIDDPAQIHNFCNPQNQDRTADQDWFKFSVHKGQNLFVEIKPLTETAAAIAELYADDATTLLTSISASDFGDASKFIWTSDRSGDVYLRVRHLDDRVIGSQVAYRIRVEDTAVFMPFVSK